MKIKSNQWLVIFLIGWLLLNGLQSFVTELDPDEAYYWLYSTKLDWGYFDHPPMVAAMIKLGYRIVQNELGVRLFFPIIQVLSFWGIWYLAGKPMKKESMLTLFLLMAAMPIFNIYGFIATPDGPLLFFAVLFLIFYQRFLDENSWTNVCCLALSMAALLYSKYHGVVLIGCVVLSHLSLWTNLRFYVAGLLGAILFAPHLYWQFSNDFPSFRYHLIGRDDIYEIKFTITYFINQVVLFSPFLFPLIIQSLRNYEAKDPMKKAYQFIIFGFWIFFFFTSFKGHTEPQWTGLLSIPIVLILYQQSLQHAIHRKWILRMSLLTIGLLIFVRILLAWNFLNIKSDFHNREWVNLLREKVQNRPVYFENSYRDASKYAFYTKDQVYAFTNVDYRKSQFDLWKDEIDLQNGSPIVVINKLWNCNDCTLERMGRRIVKLVDARQLQVSSKLFIQTNLPNSIVVTPEQVLKAKLKVKNPYSFPVLLDSGNFPLELSVFFLEQGALFSTQALSLSKGQIEIQPGIESFPIQINMPDSLSSGGKYQMGFGFNYSGLPPSVSSPLTKIIVQ